MHVKFRLPYLTGLLLLGATPLAGAQAPLPDPIAPAVIGRPLDQIRPERPVRQKPAAAKPNRPRQVAASSNKAVAPRPSAPAAAPPAAVQRVPIPQQVTQPARDRRADPRTQMGAGADQGMRVASRPPGPGAYFSSEDQALVRRYYAAHPLSAQVARKWRVGEPVPPGAALTGVPDDVRAALPVLPPGHQYVQLDGEVVLVAVHSRTVIDVVSRGLR